MSHQTGELKLINKVNLTVRLIYLSMVPRTLSVNNKPRNECGALDLYKDQLGFFQTEDKAE